MSDELIGGMIKGVVMAISLSLIGLLLFYVLNIIKKVLFKAKKTVTPLSKAVYNHSKDIVNDIKPAINEYKEKHSITKTENEMTQSLNSEINEDEIYEKIMIEIEQDNKVKSTWAKALSQSDGNKDKSESLYIEMRFDFLVQEQKFYIEKENETKEIEERVEKEIIINKEDEFKIGLSSILAIVIILFILILISNTKEISTFFKQNNSSNITNPAYVQNLLDDTTYSSGIPLNFVGNINGDSSTSINLNFIFGQGHNNVNGSFIWGAYNLSSFSGTANVNGFNATGQRDDGPNGYFSTTIDGNFYGNQISSVGGNINLYDSNGVTIQNGTFSANRQ